jgi:thioredoxin-related protein
MKKIFVFILFYLTFSACFAEDLWNTSLEDAAKKASNSNKDILIDFTGSDWCVWCQKLSQEVFETEKWKNEAPKKYVLVVVDFPQYKTLSADQKKYNFSLQKKFNIKGYPTILILDSKGKLYAKTGYVEGGADNYLKHLDELALRKKEIKESGDKINNSKNNDEKIQLTADLIEKLTVWEITDSYIYLQEQLAELDKDNKKGYRLDYSYKLALYFSNDNDKFQKYSEYVKKISPEKSVELNYEIQLNEIEANFQAKKLMKESEIKLNDLLKNSLKGEIAQKAYYYLGIIDFNKKEYDNCLVNLQKAIDFAPKSALANEINDAINYVKQLKAGTNK